jgi:hypothetical protein
MYSVEMPSFQKQGNKLDNINWIKTNSRNVLGRHGCSRKDSGSQKIECEFDLSGSGYDYVSTAMKLRVP